MRHAGSRGPAVLSLETSLPLMSDLSNHVNLSASGPPETVLAPEDPEADKALAQALETLEEGRRAAVSDVLADSPQHLEAWARLGDLGRDVMESYAAYRVGYHRGLDRLRQSGWRGSGFVRWEHPTNRGFLRSLAGLSRMAAEIGEDDEAARCELFLRQLDPTWSDEVADGKSS